MSDDDRKGAPPLITPETEPFWASAEQGRLVVDHCHRCGGNYFPPRRWCATCMTADTIDPWHELRGPARLYSFTINHYQWLPGMETPFMIGLAQFDDAPGVRIPCRVRAERQKDVRIDCLLDVAFEAGPGGVSIASFIVRPRDSCGEPSDGVAPPPS